MLNDMNKEQIAKKIQIARDHLVRLNHTIGYAEACQNKIQIGSHAIVKTETFGGTRVHDEVQATILIAHGSTQEQELINLFRKWHKELQDNIAAFSYQKCE